MMQNLLVERFRLAAHFEKRVIAGYQLVVAKRGPKLAAPPGGPDSDEDSEKTSAPFRMTFDNDGYPQLPPGRHYAMTIANDRARWRFADESMNHFAGILGNQIHQPILNATGLTRGYDFVVSWSAAAPQPDASADSGPTIFAAIQEQLGLKLVSAKIAVDTLVIDHIEKSPSED